MGGGGKYIYDRNPKNIKIISQILFSVFNWFGRESIVSQTI